MEFWGIEIKPGSPIKVELEEGYLIHVSQVTLGDSKKVKDEIVSLYVKVGDSKQKLIIGNLSQKIPQASLDLIFERYFELSHECKSSSVFVLGYKTLDPNDEQLGSDIDSDEEEIPMDMFQSELEKSNANGVNGQKANLEADESDSDEENESDSDEMGSDDDSDDEENEEEAPLKVEPPSKKRPNGGAMNNTNASKKAKVAQKPSGGHKGHNCGGVHPPKRN
ncbi:hypothetical protein EUTSA_v10017218mg [Eutrema salsugineum]|uniref:Nucleoplasmin-like domain-containing protein n=1 Tax=Eutrema salsugineum TaxID=72664 RepID=V4M4U1_EUTSA|nr:histone deacetylase HDT4 [Eutrema salsugineum]ESQ51249.1 hypothetical protein EUTSA_v10017218mg [Eutrema salsugineum]